MAINGDRVLDDSLKPDLDLGHVFPVGSVLDLATASSSPVPNSNLSKDEVAWYFVEQYYTTLSKGPEKLHLFYSKRSQFVCGLETEVTNVSIGRQDIQDRIRLLDFQNFKVRVSNVDSQASGDNIVIQVIGEKSIKGAPEPQKFVQTFLLAPQQSGYFVLNDILRYLVDEADEDNPAKSVNVQHQVRENGIPSDSTDPEVLSEVTDPIQAAERQHSATNHALGDNYSDLVGDSVAPSDDATHSTTLEQTPEPDEDGPTKTLATATQFPLAQPPAGQDPAPALVPSTFGPSAFSPSALGTLALGPSALPPSVYGPSSEAQGSVAGHAAVKAAYLAHVLDYEGTSEAEKSKDITSVWAPVAAAPALAPASAPIVRPALVQEPLKVMSWASRAAAAVGNTLKTSAPQPMPPPKIPASTTALKGFGTTITPPHPVVSAPANHSIEPPASPSDGPGDWQTAGVDIKKQQRPLNMPEPSLSDNSTLAYVKGVSDRIKADELRRALEVYGDITYFDINRQKQCAFLEYTMPTGLFNAKVASPFTVSGEAIVVEDRKPKANAYGGSNYGSRGTFGRGRGNWDNGRDVNIRTAGPGVLRGASFLRGRGLTRGRGASWAARKPADEDDV